MTMWIIILVVTLLLTALTLFYLANRIGKFYFLSNIFTTKKYHQIICHAIVLLTFCLVGVAINFVNAIVCALHFAFVWLISDLLFYVFAKITKKSFAKYYSGFVAIVTSIFILSVGWYLDHNVSKTEYDLYTSKNISPLKIAMFADSHLGTTFNAPGFIEHLGEIEKQNPDVLVIVGDYVDDDTNRDDMFEATKALGQFKSKYGVYFVFGNHDKGYYGSERRGFSSADLVNELEKNNVTVLRDEVLRINDDVYLIGRLDYSIVREQKGSRKSMKEFSEDINQTKYSVVLDHQPTDYKNQALSKVDLVLSGHTHGGQLFPINILMNFIGSNNAIYGLKTIDATNFIVTSGISDWAIKFKTGTKSEYVIINVKNSN